MAIAAVLSHTAIPSY